MAAVPKSTSLYSPSNFRTRMPAAMTASSSIAFASCKKVASLPESGGLRIQSQKQRFVPSSRSRNQRVLRRGTRIVCEAQDAALDTALDIPTVSETTWESLVIEADGPTLVEFWAPWCGPCRILHPIIGELSEQFAGKLKCFKLNTDESRSVATRYGIRSVPTTLIFINGEKKETVIGAVPKNTLTASIEKFL